MYPFYLGIDLHKKNTYVVLLDRRGNCLDERKIKTDAIETYLEEMVPCQTHAVLEATRNWPFLYDKLFGRVDKVTLAHPAEVKAISSAVVKTDQIDAKVLANLARMDYLPEAYAAPPEIRDLRTFLRHREELVTSRTQAKNRVHALLVRYNPRSPRSDLFGKSGKEYIDLVAEHMQPLTKQVLDNQRKRIEQLTQMIAMLEAQIEDVLTAEQRKIMALLMSVPGIGKVNAGVILAEIGDVSRFDNPKSLCKWAGLVPRVSNSDEVVRHGRISKAGSAHLRAAMTRAAAVASWRSSRWQVVHERHIPRCGRKGAKVVVARRLLTVIYHIWTRQTPYREDYV